jgi:PQQ-dependent catabolism-associated beta-propeller protein
MHLGTGARGVIATLALFAASGCDRQSPAAHVYVSNEGSGTISVIETSTDQVVDTIAVGKRPRGLRLSRDGQTLYVALSGSPRRVQKVHAGKGISPDRDADGIGVIDVRSRRLVKKIAAGQDPEAFDLSRDGQHLYVSNEETAETGVVDVERGVVVQTIAVGHEPEGVATRPDGRVVYVTSEAENQVSVIDAVRHEVIQVIPTGARPRTVLFDREGRTAFVTNENGASVTVIDAQAHRAVREIALPVPAGGGPPARPMGAALSPDERTLYVANGRGRTISIVDVAALEVRGTLESVGDRLWGLTVSPDGKKLYATDGPSNAVVVVDVGKRRVVKRIPVGELPWTAVVHPS